MLLFLRSALSRTVALLALIGDNDDGSVISISAIGENDDGFSNLY
jgi:hypothetical protein